MRGIPARNLKGLKTGAAVIVLGLTMLSSGTAAAANQASDNNALNQKIMSAIQQCERISTSCAQAIPNAAGVLVFPSVLRADLIVGGSGGHGALIQNNQVTGYYNIGSASAGLQAGIENTSQIYVFRTQQALEHLTNGSEWNVGASAGVTVVSANVNASAVTGDILAYIFDSKGLHGGASVNLLYVWKSGQPRPAAANPHHNRQ